MPYNKDIDFAKKVCDGDEESRSEFYELICDEMYFQASKFNNLGVDEEYWEYRTKKGYSIKVDNEVADTVMWLFKHEIKKTCKYKGLAPLIHFIRYDLFNAWTRKMWLRHKTGITDYVPRVIQNLTDQHIRIFKELRFRKSKEQIMKKFDLNESEFFEFYDEIKTKLTRARILYLIRPNIKIKLKGDPPKKEIQEAPGLYTTNIEHNSALQIDYLVDNINKILSSLDEHKRRLLGLYWGHNRTPKEIFTFFSNAYTPYLYKFDIEKENDVQKCINKVEYDLFQYAKKNAANFIDVNKIDNKKFKTLLKYYFEREDSKIYNDE